jgi:phosphohistidine phosphatase
MAAPFQLYLIRHGVAEERGDAWPDDAKRPLTQEGTTRLRRAARALLRLDVAVDVVLTSPLVRARQTAELLATAFTPHPSIINVDALAPGGAPAVVAAEIEKQGRRRHIFIVGHEPALGELAAWLIGTRNPIAFKKGGICRIDCDAGPQRGSGALRWMLTPKLLRALKK